MSQFSVCCLGCTCIIPRGILPQVELKSLFVLMNVIVVDNVNVMSSY